MGGQGDCLDVLTLQRRDHASYEVPMDTAHVLSETAIMMYHWEKTVETSIQVVEQHGRSYEVFHMRTRLQTTARSSSQREPFLKSDISEELRDSVSNKLSTHSEI